MNVADVLYLRVVADVNNGRQLNARMKEPLTHTSPEGIIALSKHLCGGATDCILRSLCSEPLEDYVGAACIAPCCHQKIRKKSVPCPCPSAKARSQLRSACPAPLCPP